ncbi:unnamed protein product [Clonostachys byssicola]|uniref:Uncharacterized protein n=1 Tax=Clonostachys byssicola TaxID=160290 RepID=A0A9N9XZR9_9HYPO|nr:unnamed protein product [Clonostachys byssicola]
MPYRSRHGRHRGSAPALMCYRGDTRKAYLNTPLERNEEYEAKLQQIKRCRGTLSQEEIELQDELMAMEADQRDTRCAALKREIESYFDKPKPFPPPLPRSSIWLEHTYPYNYRIEHMRMFYLACQEGRLNDVEEWLRDRRDMLSPIGLRDGLDVAAMGSQVHVVRYFIEEVGVGITGAAVMYACRNQSLPLFELFIQHGYHPNQQVPSNCGSFGTALLDCLGSEDITRLLLENGADPNAAPFMDGRRHMWGQQSTVPMDRTSGLLLDKAVEKHSFAVVKLLLEHGAEVRYSRPLERLIRYRGEYLRSVGLDDDWRPLIEMLLSYGADINAVTYGGGTALSAALHRGRWDVVEFLIQNGADGRVVTPVSKKDSFAYAAEGAQVEWEITNELKEYLDYLCGSDSSSIASHVPPPGVDQNPLVKMFIKVKTKRDEAGGQHDRK